MDTKTFEERIGTIYATNKDLEQQFPQLKSKACVLIVVGRGEPYQGGENNNTTMVPLLLAQKAEIGSAAPDAGAAFFMDWDNSRLLRTIQNATPAKAEEFKNGTELEGMNLQLERSTTPYWEGQEEVIHPDTSVAMGYYQNIVVVQGDAVHQSVPAIGTASMSAE